MSLRWDHHFLQICVVCAEHSKDPNTRVGAVIVGPDREIRSTGFNGFPRGIADTPERLGNREVKNSLVIHAEENAILNAARVGVPLAGCTLYVAATDDTRKVWGGPPCLRCSLQVIQAGIVEVRGFPFKDGESHWRKTIELGRATLGEAGVPYVEVPR